MKTLFSYLKERVTARKGALWATCAAVCVIAAAWLATRPAPAAQAIGTPDDGETTAPLSNVSETTAPPSDSVSAARTDGGETVAPLPDAEAMTPDGATLSDGESAALLDAAPPEAVGAAQRPGQALSPELDAAVRDAIISHDKGLYAAGAFDAESHVALAVETDGNIARLYLMSLRESFDCRDGRFESVSGRSGPVALAFRTDGDAPTLAEYWEPRDGAYYWGDLREKFPASLTDKELDAQTYILWETREVYRQVVEHWGVDTAPIIGALFDAFQEPATSSNPGDYLDANPLALRELLYYGEYTRTYIQENIGAAQGLRQALMRLVLERLDAAPPYSLP